MKTFIVLFLAAWVSSSAFGQTTAGIQKTEQQGLKAAVMTFDDVNHDFGEVLEGQKLSHTFVFTNTGTDTLRIKKIDCGKVCSVTEKYDTVVAPGQTGMIVVTFDTDNKLGYTYKKLVVLYQTDAGEPSEVTLNVAASVIVKL